MGENLTQHFSHRLQKLRLTSGLLFGGFFTIWWSLVSNHSQTVATGSSTICQYVGFIKPDVSQILYSTLSPLARVSLPPLFNIVLLSCLSDPQIGAKNRSGI